MSKKRGSYERTQKSQNDDRGANPPRHTPYYAKTSDEQTKAEHGSGEAKNSQETIPKLRKQFKRLSIREENKEVSKTSHKTPTETVNSRPMSNSRWKNDGSQNKTKKAEATRTSIDTTKVSKIRKESSQKVDSKKRGSLTTNVKQNSVIQEPLTKITQQTEKLASQKQRQIESKLKETEQTLPDKEDLDYNKHDTKQMDYRKEISEGDKMEETGESDRGKEKKKRKRKKRRNTDKGRKNEQTRDDNKATDEIQMPIRSPPRGLVNLANTCFFNAIMQNLSQSFVLGKLLYEQKLDLPLSKSVVEFYEQMDRKDNKPLNPSHLFQSLCTRSPRFNGGRQQDSHELLRHLLDGLRNEEREASPNSEKRKILTNVDRVFGGHFLTVYTCSDCSQPYYVCEPFLDISIPIEHQEYSDAEATLDKLSVQNVAKSVMTPLNDSRQESPDAEDSSSIAKESDTRLAVSGRKRSNDSAATRTPPHKRRRTYGHRSQRSILDCLSAFTRQEFITKEYLCMICHEKQLSEGRTDYQMSSAIKRTLVCNPPALLTLHLKRFTQTSRGFVKCNDMITFPDKLDLSPYCSSWCMRNDGKEMNIWYSLYGVVVHDGELSRGHYYAYVKVRTPDINVRKFLQKSFLQRDEITAEKLEALMKETQVHLNKNPRREWKPAEAVKGTWFYVSDCHCYPVQESDVLQRSAYLLFYERLTRPDDVL